MNFDDLARLIPLGGATFLIVFVLGIVIQERHQWTVDRREMEARHDEEMENLREQHRAALETRDTDAQRTIAYLRKRVEELTEELIEVRAQMRVMGKEIDDLRGKTS